MVKVVRMFSVVRGLVLVRNVRRNPQPGRRDFRSSRSVYCEDTVWPWKWWEKPLPIYDATEKKIEWTPVLVITNISFRTGFQGAETKMSWWRTECDG